MSGFRLRFWLPALAAAMSGTASAQTTFLVSPAGGHNPPFADWANAATTIQAAVNLAQAGDTVLVTNGVYTACEGAITTALVRVTNGIQVVSVSGPAATIVDAQGINGRRGLEILPGAAGATVSGFTFRRGRRNTGTYDPAGGVLMYAGVLTNSIVSDSRCTHQGGGVYLGNGVIADCTIVSNYSEEWQYGYGGGFYMTNGMVLNCRIRDNWTLSHRGGGGVYLTGGSLRNCLITGNRATMYADSGTLYRGQGGGVRMTGGSVVGCTIARNQTSGAGGGLHQAGGGVTNCIVFLNSVWPSVPPEQANVSRTAGAIAYSCSRPLESGAGNTDGDPLFADAAGGDYRVRGGSAAMDSGTNLAGVVDDIEGRARPVDGDGDGAAACDMGAYEADEPTNRAYECDFRASAESGIESLGVILTAGVSGPDTNIVYFRWDLDVGATPAMTVEGPDLWTVETNYGVGWHTVSLAVSNSSGAVASRVRPAFIRVAPAVLYVATNGAHVPPFATPADAATNLQQAVDAAYADAATGSVIDIAAGTYRIGSDVGVAKGVTLRGGGPEASTIMSTSATSRCLAVAHSNAIVSGLTLRGASTAGASYYGGAVLLTAGLVSNCVVTRSSVGGRGGGVWMSGGVVSRSLISSNWVTEWQLGLGGGVYMSGGQVSHSVIASNTSLSHQGGAGVYVDGGVVRNCLITTNVSRYANAPNYGKGGGLRIGSGGLVESCTIADNFSEGPGGGIHMAAGGVTNCIVVFNSVDARNPESDRNLYRSGGSVGFSDTIPLAAGPGNIAADPDFLSRSGRDRDYRLGPVSSCIDHGTNRPWMGGAADLAGSNRIEGGAVDIGAYEAPPAGSGPLAVSFTVAPDAGYTNVEAVFTANAVGADSNLVYYWWDFNTSGVPAMTVEGPDLKVVTNRFGSGYYSVSLTARNAGGEMQSIVREDVVRVAPAWIYVSTNGAPRAPFMTWATATPNLQDAVNAAGGATGEHSSVLVGTGTYVLANSVGIARPVAVFGVGGPEAVRLRGGNTRVLQLSDADALVAGMTIAGVTNSAPTYDGGGVYITAGTLSNCVLFGNSAGGRGGGVYLGGGAVVDCRFTGNRATEWQYGFGGGAYVGGGAVDRCTFVSNRTDSHQGGGGLYVAAGTVRNCLVSRNRSTYTAAGSEGDGGGAVISGGQMINCTIAHNWSVTNGGGLQVRGGGVTNCIVYDNTASNQPAAVQDLDLVAGGRIGWSCSPALAPGTNGNLAGPPLFRDGPAGDYRLGAGSPCRDTGAFFGWMLDGQDLDRTRRVWNGAADMGAYEAFPPARGQTIQVH